MPDLIDDNGTWVLQPDKDLADLEMNVIDVTDGSWSHIDVNSQVKSFSFSGEVNTATLNAVSSGTSTQFSNNAYQGARWYKLLKDSKGVQVNTDERFIFIATIQAQSSSNPAAFGYGFGTSVDPLATGSVGSARQNFQHIALVNELQSGAGFKHEYNRMLKLAGGGVVANHLTSSICQLIHNFGDERSGGSVVTNNISNCTIAAGTNTSGTDPLYLQVGIGTRYNTVSALEDAEHKAIMKYVVIRLDSQ